MRRVGYFGLGIGSAIAGLLLSPSFLPASLLPIRERIRNRVRRYYSGGPARLNRSRQWPYAATYREARALSPFPLRPVR